MDTRKRLFLLPFMGNGRLSRANDETAPQLAAGECPELYFLKNGRYIANAHTPLAWTQAKQALALRLMEQSVGEK